MLHDVVQLFMYEALGLCKEGDGGRLLDQGLWKRNKAGGELFHLPKRGIDSKFFVSNPSGGLECKGNVQHVLRCSCSWPLYLNCPHPC